MFIRKSEDEIIVLCGLEPKKQMFERQSTMARSCFTNRITFDYKLVKALGVEGIDSLD